MKEDIQKVDGTEEDAWDRMRWKHLKAAERRSWETAGRGGEDEGRAGNRKEGKMEKVNTKQYTQKNVKVKQEAIKDDWDGETRNIVNITSIFH